MERIVKKSHGHAEAADWDIQQQLSMTPQERLRVARTLKDRAFPPDAKDVRACHQSLIRNTEASGRPKGP